MVHLDVFLFSFTSLSNEFNQEGAISTLTGSLLKLGDKFMYLGSSISSTKTDVNMLHSQIYRCVK